MWMIRSRTKLDNKGQPKYWSADVGWTWKEFADIYSSDQKSMTSLPKTGVWEEL